MAAKTPCQEFLDRRQYDPDPILEILGVRLADFWKVDSKTTIVPCSVNITIDQVDKIVKLMHSREANYRALLQRVQAANIAQGCSNSHPRILLIYDIEVALGERDMKDAVL